MYLRVYDVTLFVHVCVCVCVPYIHYVPDMSVLMVSSRLASSTLVVF